MYLVYVVCVYIYIIRTQPEWKFSINKNMLLGLILKRTFSIKRNLARALYRSSCRGRWQHHTWCSTLKWIKVTAGNFTPCQWLTLHLMYCQCHICVFLFTLYDIMQELCLIAIVYLSQLRIYPFPAHSLSASILLVPLFFYLARSSFLSLTRPPPLLFPSVFMCENCGVCFDVGSILSSKNWCKRILSLKTERDLIFLWPSVQTLTEWHELVLKTRRGLKMKWPNPENNKSIGNKITTWDEKASASGEMNDSI